MSGASITCQMKGLRYACSMTNAADWSGRVGASWAENHIATDRALAGLTEELLQDIGRLPGRRIVDIGCGAGELSLALGRERASAHVLGLDISADLIATARERGTNRPNVEFRLADASDWRAGDFAPDLLVSRHGVMFFADPIAAFANLRRGANEGAALCFSCFRDADLNPWAQEAAALFGRTQHGSLSAPGPFAFADPVAVTALLAAAGWRDIVHRQVDFAFVAGSGERAIDDATAFFTRIGPAARAIANSAGTERTAAMMRLRDWVASKAQGDLVALPAAAWIVTARV